MQMAIQHTKDPKHYYLFATYFEQGIGTDVDLEQAYYWYQKALENGYEKARINVSSLAELGVISKASNYAPECWQSCGLIKG
jgi:TPR repeat protein